jgi:hypothetical protein
VKQSKFNFYSWILPEGKKVLYNDQIDYNFNFKEVTCFGLGQVVEILPMLAKRGGSVQHIINDETDRYSVALN